MMFDGPPGAANEAGGAAASSRSIIGMIGGGLEDADRRSSPPCDRSILFSMEPSAQSVAPG